MREAPGPIPKILPNVLDVAKDIQHNVIDRPDIRLSDMSIGQLVGLVKGPTYLTGSNVWLRSIFGGIPDCIRDPKIHGKMNGVCKCSKLDFDLIFASKTLCEEFISSALVTLNYRMGYRQALTFKLSETQFGSARIMMPNGTPIIDAWYAEPNETITELLMDYPEEHQKSAYLITEKACASNVVRMTRPGVRTRKYPGRANVNRDVMPASEIEQVIFSRGIPKVLGNVKQHRNKYPGR